MKVLKGLAQFIAVIISIALYLAFWLFPPTLLIMFTGIDEQHFKLILFSWGGFLVIVTDRILQSYMKKKRRVTLYSNNRIP